MFLRTRLGVYSPASVTGTGTAVLPKDIRARHEATPSLEGWGAPVGVPGGVRAQRCVGRGGISSSLLTAAAVAHLSTPGH